MSVLISVAHSAASVGAVNDKAMLQEYLVSQRASIACYRSLSGEFAVELFDVGKVASPDYAKLKVDRVNTCKPALAVELHCNAGPEVRCYSEVIFDNHESLAVIPGRLIAESLADGFKSAGFDWPSRGARMNTVAEDGHRMFFLRDTHVPSLIIEGLFITHPLQAKWLVDTGAEEYGVLVANGIKRWLRGER